MKTNLKAFSVTLLTSALLAGCNSSNSDDPTGPYKTELNVISANMWHSLSRDFNDTSSFEIAVNELKHANADIVFLSEASGVNVRLAEALGMYVWQGEHNVQTVGIISKYPILKGYTARPDDQNVDRGANIGALLDVNGRDVVVWSNHLDYTNYITYDARGGNGVSWAAREGCVPVQDSEQLNQMNRLSKRPAQAKYMLEQLQPYMDDNTTIIFGGDFNEPSGLDWTEDTAQMYDRKGTVHDFLTHRLIRDAGYVDTYRELNPDPVINQGATWPFHQEDSWMGGQSYIDECGREQDDRDRIDLIYYNADAEGIELVDASLIGPRIYEYFPGPHGEDDTYTWDEKHTGLMVDEHGKPQYGERDFVSDHLWYKTTFVIDTPAQQPQRDSVSFEPEFDNVELSSYSDSEIKLTFTLENLGLWSEEIAYRIQVMGDNTGARSTSWLDVNLDSKPEGEMSIILTEEVLTQLTESELDNALQLRLRPQGSIAGWHKHYAVLTISKDELAQYANF
ncbi:endonuclease/exonuclease/phosphatase family protein [Vibrio agarivorans]|uniref:Endonuclease/exonuclease/phosphatase domain-containing protein n=1 Tax=Vibrio agarivorans TaxID=153622 RepID=A0ABT7XYY6_9VIBR|nr:endonuclease/exonuclease/phosphatase family protein [Vibrio agarivorans]MDN2480962.1 hypothetical protein [Vibrio agarivorans]